MVKVAFETVGCSANYADSEQMAGLLQEADFEITEDIEQADIVVINTCTVKGPTETKFFKRLAELKDGYKQVVIADCIAQSDKKDPRSTSIREGTQSRPSPVGTPPRPASRRRPAPVR